MIEKEITNLKPPLSTRPEQPSLLPVATTGHLKGIITPQKTEEKAAPAVKPVDARVAAPASVPSPALQKVTPQTSQPVQGVVPEAGKIVDKVSTPSSEPADKSAAPPVVAPRPVVQKPAPNGTKLDQPTQVLKPEAGKVADKPPAPAVVPPEKSTPAPAATPAPNQKHAAKATPPEAGKPAESSTSAGQPAPAAQPGEKPAAAGRQIVPKPPASGGAESVAVAKGKESEQLVTLPKDQILSPIPHVNAPHPHTSRTDRRRSFLQRFWSLIVFVALPCVGACVYYGFIASDVYESRAEYAIKGHTDSDQGQGGGILSKLAGGGGADADMIIVREYLRSRQILEDIRPHLDLRKMYSTPKADPFSRLNPKISQEKFLLYWRSMVLVRDDPQQGYTDLAVRAFTPEDAKAIGDEVLKLSEELVNRISKRSHEDAIAMAKKQVDEAHERLIVVREKMLVFQKEAGTVDPLNDPSRQGQQQGDLNAQRINCETQLDFLRKSLPEDAPAIVQTKQRLEGIIKKLAEEKINSTSTKGNSATQNSNTFNRLFAEINFAENDYQSAKSNEETARIVAARQSRYLEAFVRPQLPEYPEFPRRIWNICLFTGGALLLWGIGTLFVAAAKEHL